MRSFEEIDRDMAGVTGECVRRAHGCTYPACQCPRPEARSIAAGAAAAEGVKKPASLAVALSMLRDANIEATLPTPMCWDLAIYITRLEEAIAASPSMGSAGAIQQPVAWMTEDGERVVTAKTKAQNDIGAGAHAMRAYTIALFASPLGASAGDAGATNHAAVWKDVRWERRHGFLSSKGDGSRSWGAWQACSEAEAALVTGLRSWQIRKLEVVASVLAGDAPAAAPAQQSDSVHSSAPGADVGKTLESDRSELPREPL